MKSHLFSFETTWHVPHDLETVWNCIGMVAHYPTWWPGMKEVEVLHGNELPIAVGNAFHFIVASPLYQLSYTTTVTDYRIGSSIVVRADGDLVGRGVWTFEEKLEETVATFVWEVELTPSLLHTVSLFPPIRVIMRFFHARLMRAGERGLVKLLASSPKRSLVQT